MQLEVLHMDQAARLEDIQEIMDRQELEYQVYQVYREFQEVQELHLQVQFQEALELLEEQLEAFHL